MYNDKAATTTTTTAATPCLTTTKAAAAAAAAAAVTRLETSYDLAIIKQFIFTILMFIVDYMYGHVTNCPR
jgi:hypothetical protein